MKPIQQDNREIKETKLQRVIRRSEAGEIGKGGITIRISLNGYSVTRFCDLKDYKDTMEELKKTGLMALKVFKRL